MASREAELSDDGSIMQQKIEDSIASKFVRLAAAIACGIGDADGGRLKDAGAVFDRLEAKYRELARR